jgi:ElaB/YqjD/DUF883 family membrane-anchored ribosome-binding protein
MDIEKAVRRRPEYARQLGNRPMSELRATVFALCDKLGENEQELAARYRQAEDARVSEVQARVESQRDEAQQNIKQAFEKAMQLLKEHKPLPLYLQGLPLRSEHKDGRMGCPNIIVRNGKRQKCANPISLFEPLARKASEGGVVTPETLEAFLGGLKGKGIMTRCKKCGKGILVQML